MTPLTAIEQEQMSPFDGTNPLDRMQILVAGEMVWVERRDLCTDDGELIAWLPCEAGA